jgi:hypothetical protein
MEKAYEAGGQWVVEFSDEYWMKNSDNRQEFIESYRQQAKDRNCASFSIFVIADPLLPLHGYTGKTRVHVEKLQRNASGYEVTQKYVAEIAYATWSKMPQEKRADYLNIVRENLNRRGQIQPGKYEIIVINNGEIIILERGRV